MQRVTLMMEVAVDYHRVLLLGEPSVGIPALLADLFRHHNHSPAGKAKAKATRVRISICPPRENACLLSFDCLQRRLDTITARNFDYATIKTKESLTKMIRLADIIVYCYSASNVGSFDEIREWQKLVKRETSACKFRHAAMLLRLGLPAGISEDREMTLAKALGVSVPDQMLPLHAPASAEDLDSMGLKCCRVSILLRSERQGIALEPRRVCPPECKIRQPHRHEKKTSEFLGTEDTVILETVSPSRATMSSGLDRDWMRSAVAPPARQEAVSVPLPVAPQPKLVANNSQTKPGERTSLLVKRGQEGKKKSWF